jgi:hypothetical protein
MTPGANAVEMMLWLAAYPEKIYAVIQPGFKEDMPS